MEIITEEHVDKLYTQIVTFISTDKNTGKNINIPYIIELIPKLVEFAQKTKNLHGVEKKKLVINVIKKIIKAIVAESDYLEVEEFVTRVAPTIIDVIVYTAKGGVVLKKTRKFTRKLMKRLLCN